MTAEDWVSWIIRIFPQAAVDLGFCKSKSEARRLMMQAGFTAKHGALELRVPPGMYRP